MKIKLFALLFIISAVCRLHAGTESITGPGVYIVSPDHPETWEVGFNDKVGQSLRWSEGEGKLLLDVTYCRITYTNTTPPSDFVTYTVAFPCVSLDKDGNLYVLNNHMQRIIIGCRKSGPFGIQISLNGGFHLSAHRLNGRIKAVILPNKVL